MLSKTLAPIPFTLAALSLATAAIVSGTPAEAPAAAAAPAGSKAAASATAAPAKTSPAAARKQTIRQYTLKTGIVDGKMVYIDSQGKANPTLQAEVGDTVEITVSSGEGAEHDIVIAELDVRSANFNAKTGPATVMFEVTEAGRFTYFCSIPGHRQIGMEGVLEVTGSADAAAAPA